MSISCFDLYTEKLLFFFSIAFWYFFCHHPPSRWEKKKQITRNDNYFYIVSVTALLVSALSSFSNQTNQNFCSESKRTHLLPNFLYINIMPGCQIRPAIPLYFLLICEVQRYSIVCVWRMNSQVKHNIFSQTAGIHF